MTIVETRSSGADRGRRLAADGMLPDARKPRVARESRSTPRLRLPARETAWSLRQAAECLAMDRAYPDFFVSTMSVANSGAGRIYVDYNQNLAARNTIAPYSMRGRECRRQSLRR